MVFVVLVLTFETGFVLQKECRLVRSCHADSMQSDEGHPSKHAVVPAWTFETGFVLQKECGSVSSCHASGMQRDQECLAQHALPRPLFFEIKTSCRGNLHPSLAAMTMVWRAIRDAAPRDTRVAKRLLEGLPLRDKARCVSEYLH